MNNEMVQSLIVDLREIIERARCQVAATAN